MKHLNTLITTITLFLSAFVTFAQPRVEIPFNEDWQFTGSSVSGQKIQERVTIPHTWNATDAQEGIAYYRGNGVYEKQFLAEDNWNGRFVMSTYNKGKLHKAANKAFGFEVKVKYLEESELNIIDF